MNDKNTLSITSTKGTQKYEVLNATKMVGLGRFSKKEDIEWDEIFPEQERFGKALVEMLQSHQNTAVLMTSALVKSYPEIKNPEQYEWKIVATKKSKKDDTTT